MSGSGPDLAAFHGPEVAAPAEHLARGHAPSAAVRASVEAVGGALAATVVIAAATSASS